MAITSDVQVQASFQANAAPLIAVITVDKSNVELLDTWTQGLVANSVTSGLHVRFIAPTQWAIAAKVRLTQRVPGYAWSIRDIAETRDYATALAESIRDFPGSDLIVIAAGAGLPFAWDARLNKTAYAHPDIAAVTSLCDVAPMFALVDEELRNKAKDHVLIDRTAFSMSNRSYYDVPRAHAVCTYLRRDAMQLVLPELVAGNAQATLDLVTRRLRARGWNIVLCDHLYVGNIAGAKYSTAPDPVEEQAYLQNHPLAGLRRTVNAALRIGISNVSTPGLDARPVQLHIMHFWGGGLDKWVRDFGRADPLRTNLVFSSFRIGDNGGQRLVLYSDPVDPNPIRVWDIAQPIRSTVSSSIEYRRVLQQIIREFSVEAIVVSSLIGHSLDALDQPVKTIVVCHDFYPICQAINPQFEKTCERCTLEDLRRCAQSNPLNSIFVDQNSEDWHAMRNVYVDRLLANRIELAVPSPSVAATLKRLAPRLADQRMHLIPHGIDLPKRPVTAATRTAGEGLRIVVLGRLSRHKGMELLRQACDELRQYAEITLIGCGGNGVKLAKACQWNYIESYQPDELPGILEKLAPHAGLLASVIPETFSYTLSELNQLCVPSLATALGSFNDRIVDGKTGFLFEPTASALVALVRRLYDNADLLAGVAKELQTLPSERTCQDMVRDYAKLIPAEPRPLARFEVGIGMQTGLTEPYRHLNEAYLNLTAAYEHTKATYDNVSDQLARLQAIKGSYDRWLADYDALQLEKYWWRARSALRLTREFRRKLQAIEQENVGKSEASEANSAEI